MGTHSAFIQFKDGSRAFVDGIPDTCQHKFSDEVFQCASGKMIFWHTYRQWASYTSAMRNRLIYEYHESISDPIVMGTGQCRDCKKIDFPDPFMF
jgi:hypothetical protein